MGVGPDPSEPCWQARDREGATVQDPHTYEAIAYRDDRWWTFALPELASAAPVDGTNVVVVGQAQSRDELDRAAREVVALSLDVGEGSVAVRVTIVESPQ
jgi:hypothetical protein